MLIRYSSAADGKPVKKAVIYTKSEHCIRKEQIDPDALRIITHLREYGFEAYVVGGAVRDLLVGNVPKDFDIVTNAIPTKIKKVFRNARIIGKRFRLVHVIFGPKIFEVCTFRSIADGTIGNSFGSMDEDVLRRDFTLNALYYDPIKEQIIDYVGGIKDIKSGKVQPVIPLKTIFIDDPVRMLRAIKYAACTGFSLTFSLKRAILKSAYRLGSVSPSRLTEEIIKILNSGRAFDIFSLALKMNIFMELQPSASALICSEHQFGQEYMESLKELDVLVASGTETRLGQKLIYVLKTFITGLTDWKKEMDDHSPIGELYNNTWAQCRQFVLPMNPPRMELDFAVRTCMKSLGVPVRLIKAPSLRERSEERGAHRRTPVKKNSSQEYSSLRDGESPLQEYNSGIV